MQPYTSVKFSIVTIMMAYIIKLNQLSSYIQALVLICYILMVFSVPPMTCPSCTVWLSKSVYLTLLSLGICSSQKSVGEWNNKIRMASPTAAAHMVVSAPWISATVAVPLPAWLAGYLA